MADNELDVRQLRKPDKHLSDIAGGDVEPGVPGVEWKLEARERGVDPNGSFDAHTRAGTDVLIHVLSGSGRLITEQGTIELARGAFVWLPRRSQRQFTAGPDGLRYLTVHEKREILPLTPTAQEG